MVWFLLFNACINLSLSLLSTYSGWTGTKTLRGVHGLVGFVNCLFPFPSSQLLLFLALCRRFFVTLHSLHWPQLTNIITPQTTSTDSVLRLVWERLSLSCLLASSFQTVSLCCEDLLSSGGGAMGTSSVMPASSTHWHSSVHLHNPSGWPGMHGSLVCMQATAVRDRDVVSVWRVWDRSLPPFFTVTGHWVFARPLAGLRWGSRRRRVFLCKSQIRVWCEVFWRCETMVFSGQSGYGEFYAIVCRLS